MSEQRKQLQIHASCVEFAGIGVVLRGPSGAGKSDLALRMIEAGGRLVADDRVDLFVEGDGRLFAKAPAALRGRIEVRGLGIVPVPCVARARVGLIAELEAPENIERLPEPSFCDCLGVSVRRLPLAPFEESAVAKLRLAAHMAQETIEESVAPAVAIRS